MSNPEKDLVPWDDLSEDRQAELLEEFGHYQDGLPKSCDVDVKTGRFHYWLEDQGVKYP